MFEFSCRDCTERHPGCHGKCEKYINERKVYEEKQSKIRAKKESEAMVIQFKRKQVEKSIKASS